MCALAWEFLQRRIDDPNTPWQQTMLQPTLVIRESSRHARELVGTGEQR
jgi:hypothetical protein